MNMVSTGPNPRSWPAATTWFVILGVVWIILGLLAIAAPLVATLTVVWLLGILLMVGGVLHTVHAFTMGGRNGFLLHLLEGLLSIVVGVILMVDPVGGAIGLTLLIGILLLVGGVLRFILAFMGGRSGASVWLAVAGALEVILGLIVLTGWPGTAAWVIGLFIGIRMLFVGTSMLALGLMPRGAMRQI